MPKLKKRPTTTGASIAGIETPIRTKRSKVTLHAVTPSPPPSPDKSVKGGEDSNAVSPPEGWEDIYELVVELRNDRTAPCDHSGCEALPERGIPPEQFRFQVLISLMLSSQTKDAIVGEAVRNMQKDKVLNVDSISAMDASKLDEYIFRVGFHNNKTKYIKQVVDILKSEYNGDIPGTAKEMIEKLPGVGPKMAYIIENVAWNATSGIGVDTHMHRLFNKLRWVTSKTPEQTRKQLEEWLPQEKWKEVNLLWVGFGQEVQQQQEKILRKAIRCSRPQEALALLKKCGLDYKKEAKKYGMDGEIHQLLNP